MIKSSDFEIFKQILRFLTVIFTIGLSVYILAPFIIPVIIGGIFAAGLAPAVEYFIRKKINRGRSSIIVVVLFGTVLFFPLFITFLRGAHYLHIYISNASTISFETKLKTLLFKFIDSLGIQYEFKTAWLKDFISLKLDVIERFINTNLEGIITGLPNIFFLGFVTLVSLYLFLKHADVIKPKIVSLATSSVSGEKLLLILEKCAREIFITNIITGILQALIVSIGSLIFNAGDVFVVFVITFLLSFIPIIGAAPVALFLSILSFSENLYGNGIGLLFIFLLAGVSDNLIRPYLVSIGSIKVHPFINFLSIIGGVMMFGFAGLFIGPLIVGFCYGAIPIIFSEFIHNLRT